MGDAAFAGVIAFNSPAFFLQDLYDVGLPLPEFRRLVGTGAYPVVQLRDGGVFSDGQVGGKFPDACVVEPDRRELPMRMRGRRPG